MPRVDLLEEPIEGIQILFEIWRYSCGAPLVIDPGLGFDPFSVSVFDLPDLAHRVREFDDLRMGISPGEDKVHQGWLFLDEFKDLI